MSSKISFLQKLKSLALVSLGGFGVFAGYSIYSDNEKFYQKIILPAMHILPPEKAHQFAVLVNKYSLLPKSTFEDPPCLSVKLFGKQLSNPVGIAAGFDKHGEAIVGLDKMGFGFVEIGSVTPQPQSGNRSPRVFRLLADKAVINRYGFNSDGHMRVFQRLFKLRNKGNFDGIIGVNLGKNKATVDAAYDYIEGIKKFNPVADYLVVNISSPNTPGLRNLQAKEELKQLLWKINQARGKLESKSAPLLLKLSPDLTYEELKDIAEVVTSKDSRVDGLIISNTTVQRPRNLRTKDVANEAGGLSGAPLKDRSTQMIAEMYRLTNGMDIIGVGGIFNGKDAYEKIRAGAKAVQIYTALVYEGPNVVTKIKEELAELLENDGYRTVFFAVGVDAKRYSRSKN